MGSLGHRTLLNYIDTEDLAGLKTFLDSRQNHVDDRDENGTTPLMVAATKGLLPIVRELLSHGADVNAQDLDNWSALICATKAGHQEIVELLVENGANIEHREMVRITPASTHKDTSSSNCILITGQLDCNQLGLLQRPHQHRFLSPRAQR